MTRFAAACCPGWARRCWCRRRRWSRPKSQAPRGRSRRKSPLSRLGSQTCAISFYHVPDLPNPGTSHCCDGLMIAAARLEHSLGLQAEHRWHGVVQEHERLWYSSPAAWRWVGSRAQDMGLRKHGILPLVLHQHHLERRLKTGNEFPPVDVPSKEDVVAY
ncbi:hypothetical protein VTI74DRAFT_7180 [Chaetomium olivicolor]